LSSQTSKNSSQKKGGKKFPMDSEVTRVVLIFLLLLVIVALLVAAFMSLGHGAENTNPNNVYQITLPPDENNVVAEQPATTADPNHGNTETEAIPAEVLDPSLVTTESVTYIETAPAVETAPGAETALTAPDGAVDAPMTQYTTTGARPDSPTPVYIATTDPYSGIATLAPPLTTAGTGTDLTGNPTTVTTTVAQNTPGDGTITNTNYVVSLSGSASIYSSPNGSSNGTVGVNGSFTIVQEMTDTAGVKWGKLKSGAGWVRLN